MSLQALYCFLPPCPPWNSSYSCQAIVLSCIPWRKTGIASFWIPDKTHAGTRGSNIWSLFCMLLVKSTVLRIKARWSVLVVWISWQVWVVFFWAYRPSSVLCGVFFFFNYKPKLSRQVILCEMTSVFTSWLGKGYYLSNNMLHWAWSLLCLWEVIKEMLSSTLQAF